MYGAIFKLTHTDHSAPLAFLNWRSKGNTLIGEINATVLLML